MAEVVAVPATKRKAGHGSCCSYTRTVTFALPTKIKTSKSSRPIKSRRPTRAKQRAVNLNHKAQSLNPGNGPEAFFGDRQVELWSGNCGKERQAGPLLKLGVQAEAQSLAPSDTAHCHGIGFSVQGLEFRIQPDSLVSSNLLGCE